MADASDPGASREAAILDAAAAVFRRFGFKKTSMDDLARAAGLSRQGLYLHFPTKEALFRATVERVIAAALAAGRAELGRDDRELEDRLLDAYVAMYRFVADPEGSDTYAEIAEIARSIVGPLVEESDAALVADVARLLRASGVAARWKDAGVTAKDLAEHLRLTSLGAKQRGRTEAAYRDLMRTAVRVVCRAR